MPELPEVETVVRDLRPNLVGRTISSARSGKMPLRRDSLNSLCGRIVGLQFVSIDRRGKWIRFNLGYPHLLVHLGMTGQLTVGPASRTLETHTHFFADLDDGKQLRFRDIRRFGSISFFESAPVLDGFLNERLGPEPADLKRSEFRRNVQLTNRPLKAALLDQKLIAGVGNIYADESLFEARLDPRLRGTDLSEADANRLCQAIQKVIARAIEGRGSTIRNYVGGSGLQGTFQHEFCVYGRTGAPCVRCNTPIERIRLAGRSTHFCPHCQIHG